MPASRLAVSIFLVVAMALTGVRPNETREPEAKSTQAAHPTRNPAARATGHRNLKTDTDLVHCR